MNEYIILDANKKPLHKFKDGGKTWDEVKHYENIGLIIPEPFIVLDFDTSSDARIIQEIIEAIDLPCKIMKTTRGVHVWLKSATPWTNFVKAKLAVGIYADCRSWGKAGYVKIRDGGKDRQWIRNTPDDQVATVPDWVRPIPDTKYYDFKEMGAGSGRNQTLFNYILFLQKQGFRHDSIVETVNLINEHVFAEALPKRELETICRNEAFKSDEEIKEIREAEAAAVAQKFDHSLMARRIANDNNIVCVNDVLYIYKDGYYKRASHELEQITIDLYPPIKTQQRQEVINYLKLITLVDASDITIDPFIVNVINGRLNIRTGEISEHSPAFYDFSRVPVVYDPAARCSHTDALIERVFCEDREAMDLFYEILGDCLIRRNFYQRAFLFYGTGSNGKSTILRLIRRFIGDENTSTIGLDQLVTNFVTAELENKLVNIGDDINYKPIKDSGTLKKLFSGEPLTVHRKYGQPFTLSSYATQLFSANELPHNADKSDGMMRRWSFVPFNAVFNKDHAGYDPFIYEKVTTSSALSYLLNKAVEGFQRLYKRGYFVEPKVVIEAKESYKVENSSVLTWLDDDEIQIDKIVSTPRDELYRLYEMYCATSGIREKAGKRNFNKELVSRFNLDPKAVFRRDDRKRYFVSKI